MALRFVAILFFLPFSWSPLSASEYLGEYGGWDVFKADEGCGLSMEFEGEGATELTLIRYVDDRVGVLVTNYNWSAKDNEKYEITYVLNGKSYTGPVSGSVSGIRNGFIGWFSSEFVEDFASGVTLHIFLGDVRVDQLSLAGTAIAIGQVERCLETVRKEIAEAERERQRFAHIPKDPFAGANPIGNSFPRNAVPRSQERWSGMISENYPAQAIREGMQGRVRYAVIIGLDGRVLECTVIESSGFPILDEAACVGMKRYARFEPALDPEGNPTHGSWSGSTNYRLN